MDTMNRPTGIYQIELSGRNNESPPSQESASSIASHGLTMVTAATFVAGDMVGSGVLTLPKAVVDIGWIGIPLMVILGAAAGYSGTRLATCWTILEERYPECKGQIRDPYPTIGMKAFGAWARILIRVSIYLTLFGIAVVFLLLVASMVQDVVSDLSSWRKLSYCHWSLIIGAALCPVTWLGTPKDFWVAAVGALATMALTCVFLMTQIIMYREETLPYATHDAPTPTNSLLAFGTILFSFGGASSFPTIQNDMKDRSQFKKSVIVAFIVINLLYLMVCIPGYALIGDGTKDNVMDGIHQGPLVITSRILVLTHLVLTYVVVVNPICQDLEEFFKIPPVFGWRRMACRTSLMVSITFVAESIPHFSKILSLVGASTITLLTFVLPPILYIRLCNQEGPNWPSRNISLHVKVFLYEMVAVGIFGGILSTYSAVSDMFNGPTFVPPCYL